MNSPKDGFQSRSDGAAFVDDTEQTADAQASDASVRGSADVEMNQPSQTTSDMTVSKSVEVDQHLPHGALPDQARPPRRDQTQSVAPEAASGEPEASASSASASSASESGTNESGTNESGANESGPGSASSGESTFRQVPIPPASEPLQYRAIGLIRGVYQPSEEQFTRGNIMTEDDTSIDAVLLGRVMSLVKKHVDLAQPHLWVVYPRTRPNNNDLHAQIVGIWEPESLRQDDDLDADAQDFGEQHFDAQDSDEQDSDEQDSDEQDFDGQALDGQDRFTQDIDADDVGVEAEGFDSAGVDREGLGGEGLNGENPSISAALEAPAQASETPETGLGDADEPAGAADANADAAAAIAPEEKPSVKAELKTSSGATIRAIAPSSPSPTPPQPPASKPTSEAASGPASETDAPGPLGEDGLKDGYFSIRGEVVRQSRGGPDMTIKICQAPRKGEKRGRAFKLLLKGTVKRRAVGSFWDMHVQRQGNDLVIQEAIFIKDMPPTKRRGKGGPPRRGKGGPPRRRHDRPAPAAPRQGSAAPRPTPKPIKRQSRSSTPAE